MLLARAPNILHLKTESQGLRFRFVKRFTGDLYIEHNVAFFIWHIKLISLEWSIYMTPGWGETAPEPCKRGIFAPLQDKMKNYESKVFKIFYGRVC
jgi:hypothetical protein